MFSLKNKYTLDKPNRNIGFIKYSPTSLATIKKNKNLILLSVTQEKTHVFIHKTPTYQLNSKFSKTIIQDMPMVMKQH